jgi:hypothetical protein
MTGFFKNFLAQRFGRPAPVQHPDRIEYGAGAPERRTTGQLVEDLVECAVEMREVEGSHAARSFLRHARVPQSVIQRVLASPAQRRHTPRGG